MYMGGKDGILHNIFRSIVECQEEGGENVVLKGCCSPVMHNISHVVHIQNTGRVRRGEFFLTENRICEKCCRKHWRKM